jgi:putative salt-induced outer membrane protein
MKNVAAKNASLRAIFGAAVIATTFAPAVSAQNAFTGIDVAENLNEDLRDDIEEDAERDLERFGNEGRPEGFSGSFALRGIANSGNTDSLDVGAGSDINYVWGPNGIELQLAYTYGEDDGVKNEESLFYGLEYTRDLNPKVFAFAKVQGSIDEFSSFKSDTFVGFGAGYRIFNEADRQWSVQAGPGYRFADLSAVAAADVSEGAFSVSSDFAQKLTDTVYLTNDTDIFASSSDTVAYNDLAISVAMTQSLALRTSVLTEYHTDPAPGFKSTDNTFGVSLVYSFN